MAETAANEMRGKLEMLTIQLTHAKKVAVVSEKQASQLKQEIYKLQQNPSFLVQQNKK